MKPSLCLVWLLAGVLGCAGGPRVDVIKSETLEGLGAGQALAMVDGRLVVMGDSETGVMREYHVDAREMKAEPTGRVILLTRDGIDLLPHPTGLAHDATFGTFLGDTVRRRGTIWRIDLERAWVDGDLDRAVLGQAADTAAVNGSRPEYVIFGGREVVATSDYGPLGNQVRLMDVAKLTNTKETREAGVVVAKLPAGPWVQQLHWIEARQILVLVQNQVAGLKYRLTFVSGLPEGRPRYATVDLRAPIDELEGFAMVSDTVGVMLSSSRKDNLHWVRIDWR